MDQQSGYPDLDKAREIVSRALKKEAISLEDTEFLAQQFVLCLQRTVRLRRLITPDLETGDEDGGRD